MSLLAHAVYAAPRFEAEKRDLDKAIQHETREAKRIQGQEGCSWTEALRLAAGIEPQSPDEPDQAPRERSRR